MPPVNWNSNPPAMQIDPNSQHDFNSANPGQLFYGLLNVNTGDVYLVPGLPNVGNVQFRRKPVPGLGALQGGYDDGQGGHLNAATVVGAIGRPYTNSIAGFALKKAVPRGMMSARSGNNREVFANRPDGGHDPTGRNFPATWATALKQRCESILHHRFEWGL